MLTEITKRASIFIAWLSGSVAGITAIFYATGYLVTLANLRLLGLDQFVSTFDPAFYISRGGSFFYYVGSLFIIVLLLLVPLIFLLVGAKGALEALHVRLEKRARYRNLVKRLAVGPSIRRGALVAVLLLVLAAAFASTFRNVTSLLAVSGILFAGDLSAGNDPDSMIRLLACGSAEAKDPRFFDVFKIAALIGLLLYVVLRLARDFERRALVVAPFALSFVVYVSALPFVYGAVKIPTAFSEIALRTGPDTDIGLVTRTYLVNKSENDFIVWAPDEGRVVWVAASTVPAAWFGRRVFLSEILCAAKGGG